MAAARQEDRRRWLAGPAGALWAPARRGRSLGPLADDDYPEASPVPEPSYGPRPATRREQSPRGFFLDRYIY